MADTSALLFGEAPVAGQPVSLVFGDVDAPVTITPAAAPTRNMVFRQPQIPGSPVTLVFGDYGEAVVLPPATLEVLTLDGVLPQPVLSALLQLRPGVTATLEGALPAPLLTGHLRVIPVYAATFSALLPQPELDGLLDVRQAYVVRVLGTLPPPELVGLFESVYLSNTARPTVGLAKAEWAASLPGEFGITSGMQSTKPALLGTEAPWQNAAVAFSSATPLHHQAMTLPHSKEAAHQKGLSQTSQAMAVYSSAQRQMRRMLGSAFQKAQTAQTALIRQKHSDGIRSKTSRVGGDWQTAQPHRTAGVTGITSQGMWLIKGWDQDHQVAMRPPAGMYVRPVAVVPKNDCYTPDSDLLFWQPPGGNLVFFCEKHTDGYGIPVVTQVVPVRKVYLVINNASLRRVDGNIQIPVFNMSLSLDADSWAWSFSAALPGSALAALEPAASGAPVEVEAMINGVAYRALVERVGRERSFGKSDLRVSGRGKTALLDTPYAPARNFTNTVARTAQQIMGDVLSVNGVPMDWAVNWGLTDWLVPAGVFAHQGSYISAINAIAAAAGGYVQPHASLQSLRILPRYPSAPWAWDTVVPDFSLPSDVTTREGIEWVERARYNRVFVSGQQSGVLGQVTRAGTAGDLLAPMVTDALITTADAARQRGISVLANTGRQAEISLRLPVLAETGVITPGKFVQYTDAGVSRLGLVRSTSVDVGMPEIWQTLGVQSYA